MKKAIVLLLISTISFISCSDDPEVVQEAPLVVSFENLSGKFESELSETSINLVYSRVASNEGTVTIKVSAESAVLGTDFKTTPEAVNNEITVPISKGETTTSFKLTKLDGNTINDNTKIVFMITEINVENSNIQGNSEFTLGGDTFLGGTFEPTIGGPNEPNQVYVNFLLNKETVVRRDAWDLGFYSGNDFRVVLNGSLYMAAKALTTTDMNSVTAASVAAMQGEVAVGTFNASNLNYIDNPNGDITATAIAEIAADDNSNPVYLVNLGAEVGTKAPSTTSGVAVSGDPRGWKKIRILREGNGYKLQYADLDDTTFKEVVIQKDADYNFSFFSFTAETEVEVEPKKDEWNLCFTVFTNTLANFGAYGFSDFVVHNRKAGVKAYSLDGSTISFADFSVSDIDDALFEENQTVIGSTWRDVINADKKLIENIFYILKDVKGNYYKIRFVSLLNQQQERGYPEFQYKLLR